MKCTFLRIIPTDLNGDVFTEIEDINIVFVNSVFNIDSKRPPGL